MSNGAGTDLLNNNSICISTLGATVLIWEKFYVEIQGGQVTPRCHFLGAPMTATTTTVQRHAASCDFVFTIIVNTKSKDACMLLHVDCITIIVTATVVQRRCDCNHIYFFFCEVAANHNTGIGMVVSTSCGVIVYSYFHVFRLTNKGNLLFAVISFI